MSQPAQAWRPTAAIAAGCVGLWCCCAAPPAVGQPPQQDTQQQERALVAPGRGAPAPGQARGRGSGQRRGRGAARGRGPDAGFVQDRDVFHALLASHDKIQRQVTSLEDGVETVTESADPALAAKIQEHVAAMYRRVDRQLPIRMRDPLFAAIFQHADQIVMQVEKTDRGVRVTETSQDPYVVRLIQAHAAVVSSFVQDGFDAVHKMHPAPKR